MHGLNDVMEKPCTGMWSCSKAEEAAASWLLSNIHTLPHPLAQLLAP